MGRELTMKAVQHADEAVQVWSGADRRGRGELVRMAGARDFLPFRATSPQRERRRRPAACTEERVRHLELLVPVAFMQSLEFGLFKFAGELCLRHLRGGKVVRQGVRPIGVLAGTTFSRRKESSLR